MSLDALAAAATRPAKSSAETQRLLDELAAIEDTKSPPSKGGPWATAAQIGPAMRLSPFVAAKRIEHNTNIRTHRVNSKILLYSIPDVIAARKAGLV